VILRVPPGDHGQHTHVLSRVAAEHVSEKELESAHFLIVLRMTYSQQHAIISIAFVSFSMFFADDIHSAT
jgi:hypothetical protein